MGVFAQHFNMVHTMVDEAADKEAVRKNTGERNSWFDVTLGFLNFTSN